MTRKQGRDFFFHVNKLAVIQAKPDQCLLHWLDHGDHTFVSVMFSKSSPEMAELVEQPFHFNLQIWFILSKNYCIELDSTLELSNQRG